MSNISLPDIFLIYQRQKMVMLVTMVMMMMITMVMMRMTAVMVSVLFSPLGFSDYPTTGLMEQPP